MNVKRKSLYRMTIEQAFDMARRQRSLRPLLALVGKKAWFDTGYCKVYVTLLRYIEYQRLTRHPLYFTGNEF